ncbi:MAG: hypothetical protein QOI23_1384 [Chloroflexota bacterium]|jgi:hypothetical protein|nr:hypothetical protein [Chloroflexota bacterium]
MKQPGPSAGLVSGWKDETLAVETSPIDAEVLESAAVAVSDGHADSTNLAAPKRNRFDDAEVVAGEPVGMLGPYVPEQKAVKRHIVKLAIQQLTASQQNGG